MREEAGGRACYHLDAGAVVELIFREPSRVSGKGILLQQSRRRSTRIVGLGRGRDGKVVHVLVK